jgi:polyphosphate kinase 2 (PPK2 family)
MRDLWIELNQLAETIHAEGKRVAVVLEGRDGAGKSGTIRELTKYLPPYAHSVMRSFMPTKTMMKHWLSEWEKLMPRQGEISFLIALGILALYFNQSWDGVHKNNMIVLCTMFSLGNNRKMLRLSKYGFRLMKQKQKTLLEKRANDPLRYWKHSPNDAKAVSKFDELTKQKDAIFALSNDWQIVDMADKDQGRYDAVAQVINSIKGA